MDILPAQLVYWRHCRDWEPITHRGMAEEWGATPASPAPAKHATSACTPSTGTASRPGTAPGRACPMPPSTPMARWRRCAATRVGYLGRPRTQDRCVPQRRRGGRGTTLSSRSRLPQRGGVRIADLRGFGLLHRARNRCNRHRRVEFRNACRLQRPDPKHDPGHVRVLDKTAQRSQGKTANGPQYSDLVRNAWMGTFAAATGTTPATYVGPHGVENMFMTSSRLLAVANRVLAPRVFAFWHWGRGIIFKAKRLPSLQCGTPALELFHFRARARKCLSIQSWSDALPTRMPKLPGSALQSFLRRS